MIEIKYKLDKSNIHGTGIFTEEFIPKGKTIWTWTGEEMTNEDFLKLDPEEQKRLRHFSYQGKETGKWYLCNDDIEYLNHSSEANTTEDIGAGDGAGTLVAKRNIEAGEELTQDYREFESEEDVEKRGIEV